MKIRFESALDYQQEAIEAIAGIFSGQESCDTNFTVHTPTFLSAQHALGFSEAGYRNQLRIDAGKLLENVQNIQLSNGLKPSGENEVNLNALDFTVEMETGTGKTYVYLRTIMELYRRYGFAKHIIVVPSIAIREGVQKSLEITGEHFRELYDNIPYNFFVYDRSDLSKVRDFAVNASLEIMIINIDAFSKSFENPEDERKNANVIHRYNDALGYKPLELIAHTRPVVIVDEPQKTMSTPLRKKAISSLNPLMVVRYSATHLEKINLVYRLDAIDAYNLKLVKQIEVGSVQTEGIRNTAYIRLLDVNTGKGKPTAKLEVDAFRRGNIVRTVLPAVKQNQDLEELTGRVEYAGYIVQDIYAVPGSEYIDFTSRNDSIRLGEAIGNTDELQIKTALISKTIEEHLDKELVLNPQGIKVLSLFFIDSVSKYRTYDDEGNPVPGIYADIFEKEYLRLIRRPKYQSLFGDLRYAESEVSKVHNGYFSIDRRPRKSNAKEKYECFKDSSDRTNDEDVYHTIMRDKETLLSFYDGKNEQKKLRFIFSHSALKEGWDNPNVFQICALKDTGGSEIGRRQEVGRGLRLCLNQQGERVYGHEVNTLTVMAAESYRDFAENLQKEIEKDTGIRFGILDEGSFHHLVVAKTGAAIEYFGQDGSQKLYRHLQQCLYIDDKGKVQELLRSHLRENKVQLPEIYNGNGLLRKQMINRLKEAAGRLEIKNRDDKSRVAVNRKVLDSPEFKALWDRVKYKTTFSVDFDPKQLIRNCIQALNTRLKVSRGKLFYSKTAVRMDMGGVAPAGDVVQHTSLLEETVTSLPDIVSYLQNETQLTRKTIVAILTGTDKLAYFRHNPQQFITGCIDILNEEMRRSIVDGISYRKIGDSAYYEQELFANEELFGYLHNNLRKSEKSPFDYVVYDSGVESRLAAEFEQSANISVYAKLPDWFRIETPLGTYNPDWAVLFKDGDEEKLFFVVESKGSTGLFDLRPREQAKIDCGIRHFEAIGSSMLVAENLKAIAEQVMR